MSQERIQQFRQMAEADPDNELGHFSLGKALLEAGEFREAADSLSRAVELNSKMSKGYQLLGEALEAAGMHEDAVATLQKGVEIANEQGDRMPRDAMIDLLKKCGAAIPEDAIAAREIDEAASDASGFKCARCGSPGPKLPKAPIRGSTGEKIMSHTCEACWREWIPMGTKVINELGLSMTSPQGAATYDQYMLEFLQLEDR